MEVRTHFNLVCHGHDWADDSCFWTTGRFFDHYAHLGGAVFGGLYYMYGMRAWDSMRVHALNINNTRRS